MHIQIEKGFFPPEVPDRIRDLCWDSREILGAYMKVGVDLGTPGEIAERDADDDQDVCIHDTSPLQINETQSAYFSNAPHVLKEDGKLELLLTPGYVALCIEPSEDDPVDDQRHRDDRCDQVVFQMPQPGGEAGAVYHGFELNERNRIKPYQTKPLRRLNMIVQAMRRGYRQMMEEDGDANAQTHLSQVPTVSIADQFAEFLQGF